VRQHALRVAVAIVIAAAAFQPYYFRVFTVPALAAVVLIRLCALRPAARGDSDRLW
jgi:hypothetical protein